MCLLRCMLAIILQHTTKMSLLAKRKDLYHQKEPPETCIRYLSKYHPAKLCNVLLNYMLHTLSASNHKIEIIKNNIHKLIYEYQSGVLPKHSTFHQLNEFYNAILNSLENKEFSCFVFCDFM
jgi:hypothetical protein